MFSNLSTPSSDDDVIQRFLGHQHGEGSRPESRSSSPFPMSSKLALHQAVISGATTEVRELIEAGEVVNAYDETGNTPLHHAIMHHRKDVLDLLIKFAKYGPDMSPKATRGAAACAMSSNTKSKKKKNKEKIDLNSKNVPPPSYDQTFPQAFGGASQRFLELQATNWKNETPLIVAIRMRNLEMTEALLAAGANPNSGEGQVPLPLHTAAEHEDLISIMILKALLKKGAHINGFDYKWQTPLMVACIHSNAEVVRVLLANHPKAEVSVKNQTDGTALHCAARVGNASVIEMLLQNGADIHAKDHMNSIPLFEALRDRSYHCVNLLVQKDKASFKLISYIMDHLFELNCPEATKKAILRGLREHLPNFLQLYKQDIYSTWNRQDRPFASSALHYCVGKCEVQWCNLLLELKASVSAGNTNGETPLHCIVHKYCLYNRENAQSNTVPIDDGGGSDEAGARADDTEDHSTFAEIIRLLLNYGADVNALCADGCTPFHICAFFEDEKCGKLFLYAGANPESCKYCAQPAPNYKRCSYFPDERSVHYHNFAVARWNAEHTCSGFMNVLRKGNLMPLQVICRVKVREMLFEGLCQGEDAVSVAESIHQLPLPPRIKNFLL